MFKNVFQIEFKSVNARFKGEKEKQKIIMLSSFIILYYIKRLKLLYNNYLIKKINGTTTLIPKYNISILIEISLEIEIKTARKENN